MPILFILGGLATFYLVSKKAPTANAAGPVKSAGAKTQASGQPGIQNYVTQGLQALGISTSAQNTNQSQYGGSKAFMGAPATPVSTQIVNAAQNVNWSQVGTGAASMWNNLFGSSNSTAGTSSAVDASDMGTVSNDYVDPQPDLETAMNGYDSVDASSAWDSAPDYGYSNDYSDEA